MPASRVQAIAAVRVIGGATPFFDWAPTATSATVPSTTALAGPPGVNSGQFGSVTRISIGRYQIISESNETWDPTSTYILAMGESLTVALGGSGGVMPNVEPRSATVAGLTAPNQVAALAAATPTGGGGTSVANGLGGFITIQLYSLGSNTYGRPVDGTFYLQIGQVRAGVG